MHDHSTLAYNIPSAEGDPYYPIPRPENRELYARYKALAKFSRLELPASPPRASAGR